MPTEVCHGSDMLEADADRVDQPVRASSCVGSPPPSRWFCWPGRRPARIPRTWMASAYPAYGWAPYAAAPGTGEAATTTTTPPSPRGARATTIIMGVAMARRTTGTTVRTTTTATTITTTATDGAASGVPRSVASPRRGAR